MASDWPLLTGGRYSEVVVRTGLSVYIFFFNFFFLFGQSIGPKIGPLVLVRLG
jgi:hypothetical protein